MGREHWRECFVRPIASCLFSGRRYTGNPHRARGYQCVRRLLVKPGIAIRANLARLSSWVPCSRQYKYRFPIEAVLQTTSVPQILDIERGDNALSQAIQFNHAARNEIENPPLQRFPKW